jgi:hypothetical protein
LVGSDCHEFGPYDESDIGGKDVLDHDEADDDLDSLAVLGEEKGDPDLDEGNDEETEDKGEPEAGGGGEVKTELGQLTRN